MTPEEAKRIIEIEKECVMRESIGQCDRDCICCDLCLNEHDIVKAYDMAIYLLENKTDNTHCQCGGELKSAFYDALGNDDIYTKPYPYEFEKNDYRKCLKYCTKCGLLYIK